MTDDDSNATDRGDAAEENRVSDEESISDGEPISGGERVSDDEPVPDGESLDSEAMADRLDALESTVGELADRVEELERAVTWLARQQAAETGNSVCPACNTGGSLTVKRSPTGKKQVECRNCGEKLN